MSLRVQAVSSNHESRPLPRDTKNFGLLKRLASSGISWLGRHIHNSDNINRNHQQYSTHTHRNSAAASMATFSSCNSLKIVSVASSRTTESLSSTTHNHQYQKSIAIPNNENSIECMAAYRESHHLSLQSALTSSSGSLNIMHWMQNDCPKDVVPLVLAFAGPQRIASIGRINRFWRQVIEQEATWRRLCESLYKVRWIAIALVHFPVTFSFFSSSGIASPYVLLIFHFLVKNSGKKEMMFQIPGKNTISTTRASPWIIPTYILPSVK
jgi:hypothetical protein